MYSFYETNQFQCCRNGSGIRVRKPTRIRKHPLGRYTYSIWFLGSRYLATLRLGVEDRDETEYWLLGYRSGIRG